MDERIRKIIEAGIRAPSGDNCQPWRFQVGENIIDLFNVPDRDTSLYNYRQRASLVALGACIENMVIAASFHGFHTEIDYFPTLENDRHIARFNLTNSNEVADPLFDAVFERTINRKTYNGVKLSPGIADVIQNAGNVAPGCSLTLVQDPGKIKIIANIVALSDRLVFENPNLHDFLFDHIRWNAEDAARTGDGLDVRTLELAPPDRLFFPLLQSFGFVKFISLFGVTHLIAANARKLMLSASAAGIITMVDTSPQSWVNAGRLLERVWLESTRQGISFHLMTGITLLIQKTRDNVVEGLSDKNLKLINQADTLFQGITGSPMPVALLFRIGECEAPTTRSLRMAVDKMVINHVDD